MNYHHSYHVGNFADVFKHAILCLLLEALLAKDKPFYFMDTHAGLGLYDLASPQAAKTKEYSTGLLPLWLAANPPALLKPYLEAIKTFNPEMDNSRASPRFYPGSPALAQHFLRAQDKILLTDLNTQVSEALRELFREDKRVMVHPLDAYQALKALLPPPIRRGLIFIDPPYEQPDELFKLNAALVGALQRWETGIYAVWYPLKNKLAVQKFLQQLKKQTQKELLVAEMSLEREGMTTAMQGCGMVIINAPWQLQNNLRKILPWLTETLSPQGSGHFRVETL